ncbi:MAG: DUF5041 domain-containing protein [Bacteroidales bacterium]|nr:DUF5041 domain-containing protein [Bacteroidales bacterium]
MKNFLILLIIISLVGGLKQDGCLAQIIKPQPATVEDYIPLLEEKGYKVYSFDISPLAKEDVTYTLEPTIKHFVGGKEQDSEIYNFGIGFTNRDMLSQYSAESQARIIAENKMFDAERGIVKLQSKLTVSFSPIEDGRTMSFKVGGLGISLSLTFQKVTSPNGLINTSYGDRPFKIEEIKINEFYPLVLLGTFWYDKDSDVFRFCGEDSLSADMSEDFIKDIPEYYVIGVIVRK